MEHLALVALQRVQIGPRIDRLLVDAEGPQLHLHRLRDRLERMFRRGISGEPAGLKRPPIDDTKKTFPWIPPTTQFFTTRWVNASGAKTSTSKLRRTRSRGKRSVAEPSGLQRGRAGGRNREVLFDLARQAPELDHTGGAQLDG